ncbi:hypothetical protein [uncultured Fibrobacter sp.]|uniref:hypothetical protein n=1 Tax=uncultured Fibrobacter sp. TaxID=261512 RepID=UPI002597BB70|nr:hypothetical protein [uncultured Fibrobacter sp.]
MEIKECPQCGAPASASMKCCEYCKAEFFVTSLAYLSSFEETAVKKYLQAYKKMTVSNPDDVEGYMGLALCYLQMGTYPLALKGFQKIVDDFPDVALAYYYESLAIIAGRRIKIMPMNDVKKIVNLLNTAIQVDDSCGIAKILLGVLVYDYYKLNKMKYGGQSSQELIEMGVNDGVDDGELKRMLTAIKIAPELESFLKQQ